MKKHTTEQIIRKLREAEVLAAQGKGTAEICQALEIQRADPPSLEGALRSVRRTRPANPCFIGSAAAG